MGKKKRNRGAGAGEASRAQGAPNLDDIEMTDRHDSTSEQPTNKPNTLYESSLDDDLSHEEATEMLEATAEFDEDLCELLMLVLGNVAGYVLEVRGNVNKEVRGVIAMLMRAAMAAAATRMLETTYETKNKTKNETLGKIEQQLEAIKGKLEGIADTVPIART